MVGVVFFKLDGRIPLAHAIWHICVDLAALIHFNAISTHLYEQHGQSKLSFQTELKAEAGASTEQSGPLTS